MRILIAEDDQVLADGLLRTLRASGAVVDHVATGSEADAALMTNNEFDLLILDLGLPKMHGLEVLKKLRGRGSALPVLILTAADSVEYNHPYKGVELVRRYGNPAQHRHSIQVEINRKLYMDERTLAQHPEGMARLQADLKTLVQKLLAHDPR